jgi:hypothetical protein
MNNPGLWFAPRANHVEAPARGIEHAPPSPWANALARFGARDRRADQRTAGLEADRFRSELGGEALMQSIVVGRRGFRRSAGIVLDPWVGW